ncbi:unnamed protein product [Trichogramma brassicae]|uniref:ZAD domain-containing protein n=1 Tax=Trichogramma brassicae TaxID=86971 RepID=A0A6H5IG35_9HYME|nr:unnamed protein product [Trichogramma brassicae]
MCTPMDSAMMLLPPKYHEVCRLCLSTSYAYNVNLFKEQVKGQKYIETILDTLKLQAHYREFTCVRFLVQQQQRQHSKNMCFCSQKKRNKLYFTNKLPPVICGRCVSRLEAVEKFRLTAQKAEDLLKTYVEEAKTMNSQDEMCCIRVCVCESSRSRVPTSVVASLHARTYEYILYSEETLYTALLLLIRATLKKKK